MCDYEWTDSIEHTLDMIRLNCVNLSEYHKEQYEVFKSRSTITRIPIFVLTSINAYAAVGIRKYLKQAYISDINCGISIFIALMIVIQAILQYQGKMETEIMKFKEYYLLSVQIFKILHTARIDRKVDGKVFLEEKFSKYEELVSTSDIIQHFKDDLLQQPDNMITEPVIDKKDYNKMCQQLFDHWNILYNPKIYYLKKRNASIIKSLKEQWREVFSKDDNKKEEKEKKAGETEESQPLNDVENPKESDEAKFDEIQLVEKKDDAPAEKKEEKKEETIFDNPFYNPFSYDIFNTGFVKEQLDKDQKELEKMRKMVKEQIKKNRPKSMNMSYL